MNTIGLIFGIFVIGFILFCAMRMASYSEKSETVELGHFEQQGHVWVVDYTLNRKGDIVSSDRREIPVDRKNW